MEETVFGVEKGTLFSDRHLLLSDRFIVVSYRNIEICSIRIYDKD